jgi:hypothetical protein
MVRLLESGVLALSGRQVGGFPRLFQQYGLSTVLRQGWSFLEAAGQQG